MSHYLLLIIRTITDRLAQGVGLIVTFFAPVDSCALQQNAKDRLAKIRRQLAIPDGNLSASFSANKEENPTVRGWEQDRNALASDWRVIGNDIRRVIDKYTEEK